MEKIERSHPGETVSEFAERVALWLESGATETNGWAYAAAAARAMAAPATDERPLTVYPEYRHTLSDPCTDPLCYRGNQPHARDAGCPPVGYSERVVESLAEAVEALERLENGAGSGGRAVSRPAVSAEGERLRVACCSGCGNEIEHTAGDEGHDENCDVAFALDRIEDARNALGIRDAAPAPDAPAGATVPAPATLDAAAASDTQRAITDAQRDHERWRVRSAEKVARLDARVTELNNALLDAYDLVDRCWQAGAQGKPNPCADSPLATTWWERGQETRAPRDTLGPVCEHGMYSLRCEECGAPPLDASTAAEGTAPRAPRPRDGGGVVSAYRPSARQLEVLRIFDRIGGGEMEPTGCLSLTPNGLAEVIADLSDEEILRRARAAGRDVEADAAQLRALLLATVRELDCDTPAGVDIHRLGPKEARDWGADELPQLDFPIDGGDGYKLAGIAVLHPRVLERKLAAFLIGMRGDDGELLDGDDAEGYAGDFTRENFIDAVCETRRRLTEAGIVIRAPEPRSDGTDPRAVPAQRYIAGACPHPGGHLTLEEAEACNRAPASHHHWTGAGWVERPGCEECR